MRALVPDGIHLAIDLEEQNSCLVRRDTRRLAICQFGGCCHLYPVGHDTPTRSDAYLASILILFLAKRIIGRP